MADLEKIYEMRYGGVGENTTAYGYPNRQSIYPDRDTPDAVFKIEWTNLPFGVLIDEAKVVPFNLTREGLGTAAWGLFEEEHRTTTDRFLLVAGFKDWSAQANKLACNFWRKMGFSFIRSKSGKCTGKPQRMNKMVGRR